MESNLKVLRNEGLLAGDASGWHEDIYMQNVPYPPKAAGKEGVDINMRERCVVTERWKLILNTTRAPDLLFKLGIALAGAGEHDTACRTFNEVLVRYPGMTGAFLDQVNAEIARAQC